MPQTFHNSAAAKSNENVFTEKGKLLPLNPHISLHPRATTVSNCVLRTLEQRVRQCIKFMSNAASSVSGSTSLSPCRLSSHDDGLGSEDHHATANTAEALLDLSRTGLTQDVAKSCWSTVQELFQTYVSTVLTDKLLNSASDTYGRRSASSQDQSCCTSLVLSGVSISHNVLGDAGTLHLLGAIWNSVSLSRISSSTLPRALPSCDVVFTITCYDLFGVGLTDAAIPQLLQMLEHSAVPIEKLKLGDNKLTSTGLERICAALSRGRPLTSTLRQLHIGGNPIGPCGILALAKTWKESPHVLENLGLRNLQRTTQEDGSDEGGTNVNGAAKSWATTASTTTKPTSNYSAMDAALETLCAALGTAPIRLLMQSIDTTTQSSYGLVELQLRGTLLTSNAISNLASGFTVAQQHGQSSVVPFSHLETLDLASCGIVGGPGSGIDALLGNLLRTASTSSEHLRLRELFLQDNRIGRSACGLLGDTLSSFSLSESATIAAAAAAMCTSPQKVRCTIATLDMSLNHLQSADVLLFFHNWSNGRGDCCLNSLNLSHNSVGLDAVKGLVRILELQHSSSASVDFNATVPPSAQVTANATLASLTDSFWSLSFCQGTMLSSLTSSSPQPNIRSRRVVLTALALQNCNMSSSACALLFDGLVRFPGRFRVLEMQQNASGHESIPSLCHLLEHNKVLSKFQFQDNNIVSEAMMQKVIRVLKLSNTTLRTISAGGQSGTANYLSAELRRQMNDACQRNKDLWADARRQNKQKRVMASLTANEEQQPLHSSRFLKDDDEPFSNDSHAYDEVKIIKSPWEVPQLFSCSK
ncbi:Hypothetical protein, putative [Bodo saltans]|uniref:Leucine-rich repeat protein n=1 Tax=Bodo saltans TaxID=75058 RepID=A0A0S4KH15_BODSA|nr:Hypothetical protein, putative [Bodo saltans]|eukprot:CUI14908.1 Hypothetical protein, putative [Bodo saltans]